MLGLTAFAQQSSLLFFSPLGGVLADKYSKKNILSITQALGAVIAFVTAALLFFDLLNATWLILLIFLSSIVLAIDYPNRQSFVVELVGKKHLSNAISLNAVMFNLSKTIGPLIAGIILTYFGARWCFLLNAISFLPIFLFFLLFKPRYIYQAPLSTKRIKFFVLLKIIWQNNIISTNLFAVAMAGVFLLPFQSLLPVYADKIFAGNPFDYSLLLGFFGAGCFLGAIHLVTDYHVVLAKKQQKIFIFQLLFCLSIVMLVLSNHWLQALLALSFGGFFMVSFMVSVNRTLQQVSDDLSRGRIISFYITLGQGLMPIGALVMGYLAEFWGLSPVLLLACLLNMLFLGFISYRFYKAPPVNYTSSQN